MQAVGRTRGQVPAPVLFVLGGTSLYLGASLGVFLFDTVSPSGVAWLRTTGAALVLLAWRRPGRAAWRGRRVLLAGVFGTVAAGMNVVFYEGIARVPLGTAVAVEFLGPIAVAALGSRRPRDVVALTMVVAGVAMIADVQLTANPAGLVFILLAAALWAGYIVLGKRVSDGGSGLDDLAVGLAVGAVVLSPLAAGTGAVWTSPWLLVLGVGVGVLSSVVPYALDQVVLARVGRARFALLLALLPATAAVVGLLVLAQVPTWPEAAGITLVVAAVVLTGRAQRADPVESGVPNGPARLCQAGAMTSEALLHMSTVAQWRAALRVGELRPDSLHTQGFVHLSTPQQVHLPANRLYQGRTDLVLVCLDPAQLGGDVRWEPGVATDPGSMRFPHLYGPLPTSAAVAVVAYLPGADGVFRPPTQLPAVAPHSAEATGSHPDTPARP